MKSLIHHICIAFCIAFIHSGSALGKTGLEALPDTISSVKGSVVGVGTFQETRRPQSRLLGTGFVVLDGNYVITNAHVIPDELDEKHHEFLAIFAGSGKEGTVHPATVVETDSDHDLCLLWFTGKALPPMAIDDDTQVREGGLYAFTGFPIGTVLGLYPATHRGIISAITPIAIPVNASGRLSGNMVERLKTPYSVFQLDATAYPGNSGSPLYDIETGEVIGIINMVFVKGTKENAITDPSGITYAIPARFIKKLTEAATP
jgi:S1-C subfamily serine protease